MRGRGLVLCTLIGLAVALVSPGAFAQRVVLIRPTPNDAVLVEAFNRLRAELRLQSFEVVVVEDDTTLGSPESVAAAALREDAFAGISFTRKAGSTSADVWIADRVTGKTSMRTLALRSEREAPSVLAVRAVDLLRSSLRELGPDEAPPPEVANIDRKPVPKSLRDWARPPPPPWKLRVEGAALGTVSGVGVAYGGGVGLSRRLSERFRLGAAFAGPLVGGAWTTSTGSVSARQELGWVELGFVALSQGRLDVGAALALGVYHLEARSEVTPPLVSQTDEVFSLLAGIGPSIDFHFTESVSLGGELSLLGLTPRPGVAIAAERTLFRLPALRAGVGLGVEF